MLGSLCIAFPTQFSFELIGPWSCSLLLLYFCIFRLISSCRSYFFQTSRQHLCINLCRLCAACWSLTPSLSAHCFLPALNFPGSGHGHVTVRNHTQRGGKALPGAAAVLGSCLGKLWESRMCSFPKFSCSFWVPRSYRKGGGPLPPEAAFARVVSRFRGRSFFEAHPVALLTLFFLLSVRQLARRLRLSSSGALAFVVLLTIFNSGAFRIHRGWPLYLFPFFLAA